jgi:hypothetical protein
MSECKIAESTMDSNFSLMNPNLDWGKPVRGRNSQMGTVTRVGYMTDGNVVIQAPRGLFIAKETDLENIEVENPDLDLQKPLFLKNGPVPADEMTYRGRLNGGQLVCEFDNGNVAFRFPGELQNEDL